MLSRLLVVAVLVAAVQSAFAQQRCSELAALSHAEHDILSALEAWVERGSAPAKIIGSGRAATDPTQTLTRPLCPYPQTARYLGRGSSNDAANFSCSQPADVR